MDDERTRSLGEGDGHGTGALRVVALWAERSVTSVLDPAAGASLIVGRAEDCSLRIDDPSVSRHHAAIERTEGGRWLLRDLGSSNGTRIGGRRLASDERVVVG